MESVEIYICLPILGWGRGCRCSHADDPILGGGEKFNSSKKKDFIKLINGQCQERWSMYADSI